MGLRSWTIRRPSAYLLHPSMTVLRRVGAKDLYRLDAGIAVAFVVGLVDGVHHGRDSGMHLGGF